MKKSIASLVVPIMLLCFASSFSAAQQKSDLVGTWGGSIYMPDGEEVGFSLVIESENDKLKGTIKDDLGIIEDGSIKEILYEGGKFSFVFDLTKGDSIYIQGRIIGIAIAGTWEHPNVDSGTFIAEKIKTQSR